MPIITGSSTSSAARVAESWHEHEDAERPEHEAGAERQREIDETGAKGLGRSWPIGTPSQYLFAVRQTCDER